MSQNSMLQLGPVRDPDVENEPPEAWTPLRIAILAAGIGLGAIALGWMVVTARDAVVLVYIAALAAMGMAPVVARLERVSVGGRRAARGVATLAVYATLAAIGTAIAVTVLPTLLTQVQDVAGQAPKWVEDAQTWLRQHGVVRRELTVQELVERTPGGADAIAAGITAVWKFGGGILGLVAVAALSAYFVVEADAVLRTFVRFFPRPHRLRVRLVAQRIAQQVSAWVSGQLLLVGMIGVSTAIGLMLLGVPYFYVLAAIVAIGEIVPYVGPIVAAIPAVAVASSTSWQLALGVATFLLVQQQVEAHVVAPRVMESRLGLSPSTVLVALLVGEALLGIKGVVLAVPTAAILQVLVQELVPAFEDR